jgi:3alpha(or 20beta)-hydroxysteroid dehydrogenase
MEGRLSGSVALITGGARGQGAAEGRLFAAEGATVVLTDVLDDNGKQTAADIGDAASYLHHDVTAEDEWTSVVEQVTADHGRIDVLVNNAGIFQMAPMLTISLDDYRRIIDVNQVGVFLGMKAVAPTMVAQTSGSIINISSVAGLRGSPMTIAYTASKFAVRGMTKVASHELAPSGVRVNSIHPGIIETPMLDEFDRWGVSERIAERIPIGRTAPPDEVAKLALFLASDDSTYCTGAEFVVDGGMTA